MNCSENNAKSRASGASSGDVRRYGSCETCVYFYYDEEYDGDVCHAGLDEDEVFSASGARSCCPSYRYFDEYVSVRRQN